MPISIQPETEKQQVPDNKWYCSVTKKDRHKPILFGYRILG
jgi:hypothetical protein